MDVIPVSENLRLLQIALNNLFPAFFSIFVSNGHPIVTDFVMPSFPTGTEHPHVKRNFPSEGFDTFTRERKDFWGYRP